MLEKLILTLVLKLVRLMKKNYKKKQKTTNTVAEITNLVQSWDVQSDLDINTSNQQYYLLPSSVAYLGFCHEGGECDLIQ